MIFTIFLLIINVNISASNLDENIIELSPERWQEFRALRLEAIKERPQAIGGSIKDEEKRSLESYKNLLALAQDGQDEWFVFAQKDGELIGMVGAMCKMKHISVCRHLATLVSVYVKPEYRRMGIGKKLMDALFEKLENSERVSQVMLFVTTTESEAINFYKKCGFVQCGTLSNALFIDGHYYDQYLMQRSINKK